METLDGKDTETEIAALMAVIEGGSSHPIAQSIIHYAEKPGIQPVRFDSSDVVSGAGVGGNANGQKYEVISQKARGNEIAVEVPKGATVRVLVENGQTNRTITLGH